MSLPPLESRMPPPTLSSKLSVWSSLPEEKFLNLWEVINGLEFYHSVEWVQESGEIHHFIPLSEGPPDFLIQGKELTFFYYVLLSKIYS